MSDTHDGQHRPVLQKIARRAMLERGMLPDFSSQALEELDRIHELSPDAAGPVRDLRHPLWCSIDNDDSRDLDQLTVAEALPNDGVKVFVAVADVDALVKKDTAIDQHARQNTTSIYTEAKTFPMLPEKLSTDLTSLNYASDRYAVVVEMLVAKDGSLQKSDVYPALVKNKAKLAYNSVAAWLDGSGPLPPAIDAVPGLAENLRLQDRTAQQLKTLRHEHGALTLETIEARLVFDDGTLKDVQAEKKNRAKDIIEDFMIAANGVTARYLDSEKLPSLRRVVRTPKRWDRIMELASDHGFKLPVGPDSKALEAFLTQAQAADPLRFPDLSLSVIKLMGAGEYVADFPGVKPDGHFGLAVKDYGHSTAPNRRYPDVITQRLLKSALYGYPLPYKDDELEELAKHCTKKEDDAKKVERRVRKSAAAMLLEHRIGERFDGIVTGAADKGTWVRLFQPPIEGRLSQGFEGVDVGDRLSVELISTDVEQGYIDFKRVK
jgi:VacB/RNase II family 3'-5' exoribonuclease